LKSTGQNATADYDEISVLVQVENSNNTSFYVNALYTTEGKLFLSVEELFGNLKIPVLTTEGKKNLEGFIRNETDRYNIDPDKKTIVYRKETIKVDKSIITVTGFPYLESSLFSTLFGIHAEFNFRSLSARINSDFELPLLREKRIEEMRQKINRSRGEELPADTVLGREYHAFRFGTADWYLMGSQMRKHPGDIQAGLGLGAEVLGGETNISLNYSDNYKFDKRMQNYYWRWVDNSKSLVKQVQVGKITPQTVSSVYYPVVGASVSNTPTTTRRAMGEYTIKDYTQPDWTVELYINNELVDFTKSDASGMFVFKVPLVYGFTTLTLRFYGPLGEERTETRTINIPYNFMPKGELEYRVGAGFMQNGQASAMGRAETAYGVTRTFTLGAGIEYLASITDKPAIPFVKASFLPAGKLILTGEYDYGVRIRGNFNYYPFSGALLEGEYNKYEKDQKAILYNYLEERKINLSLPVRISSVSGFSRLGFKQNVYNNFTYNMGEILLSGYYRNLNANISTYANWISGKSAYINSMAALSLRMKYGLTARATAQVDLTNGKLFMHKEEIEKKISGTGYLSAFYEDNLSSGYRSINISIKFDLNFAQATASARVGKKEYAAFEGMRGSLVYDRNSGKVQASPGSNVGRGGVTILPFLDLNYNGKKDRNEKKIDGLSVKISGGKLYYNMKDTVITISGLEPFIPYVIELNDNNFENIAWRIINKRYEVVADPNQFKLIEVPVIPVGEVSGMINLKSDSLSRGLGRIIVSMYDIRGTKVAETLSEPDGYWSFLGLVPGEYTAVIDTIQMKRLGFSASPARRPVSVDVLEDGDIINDVSFALAESVKITADTSAADTIAEHVSDFYETARKEDADMTIHSGNVSRSELYYVQTGAFSTVEAVKTASRRLTRAVSIASAIVEEAGLHKLRLGYFAKRSDAEEALKELKSKGLGAFIGKGKPVVLSGNLDLSGGDNFVQTGAFRNEVLARTYLGIVSKATDKPCGIIIEDGLYKVRVGYFSTPEEASSVGKSLKSGGLQSFRGGASYYRQK
jgi:hypothetical protein